MTLPDLHDDFRDLAARLPAPPPSSVDAVHHRARRRQRQRTVGLLAAVAALAVGLVAVSTWWPIGPLDPVIDPQPDTDDAERGLAPGDSYTVVGALAEVPDEGVSDEFLVIVTANVEAMAARAEVGLPVDHTDAEAVRRWEERLFVPGQAAGPLLPLPPNWVASLAAHADVFDELGWSWLDVTAFVDLTAQSSLGRPPPAFGRYSVVTTAETVTFPQSATRLDGGAVQIGTTDGDLSQSSPVRPQGQALFMATLDRKVVAAGREQDVHTWAAGGPTLADDPSLSAVAAVLDEAGALTARLGRATFAPPGQLAVYDAVGIGEHLVDGQHMITIAHHFPDADPADQIEQLQTMWEAVQHPATSSPSPALLEIVDSGTSGNVAWLTARSDDLIQAVGTIEAVLETGFGPFAT